MVEEGEDRLEQRGKELLAHQLRDRDQRRAHLHVVRRRDVASHRVDGERDQLMARVEAGGTRHVANALGDEIRLLRHVHRVDVAEIGVVAEHLCIHDPHERLFQLLISELRGEDLLERGHLGGQDLILFLLRLALADALAAHTAAGDGARA